MLDRSRNHRMDRLRKPVCGNGGREQGGEGSGGEMKEKLYTAKTISGAQARVRWLEKRLRNANKTIGDRLADIRTLKAEARRLAKLAAAGPCFNSPLEAYEAEAIRNRVLAEIGLTPDGKPLAK